ncbi:LysR family transcriptional regulator [Thalassobius sp. Cn5-15]|uniref:LysR family transcriptional regulator n=1 Tax=Thalassobius sp. Cn5-15 TaxID=2917763 RepID=UPI001EF1B2B3|nr:LysR family transcriptional regulator [Thalassobius sp. Cn5-15]MCG7493034.1 LysR family transcriptional regulator [Thalassobius sp. Cn5-15]
MNVTFAQTFLEVVKVGNLNRASARLNVTESTVTTRINALENLLGQKLLIRSRSGAELTSAGFKFLRYAEIMSQAWGQARQELSLSKEFKSVCNVGCHFDLWEGSGRIWADRLRENHPDVALSFWAGDVEDIERWLSSGLVDVALMFDAAVSGGWHVERLFDDRLIQVATEPRSFVEWDPGYIYVDLGAEFRRLHAEAFSVARTPLITISSSSWAIDYLLKWGGSGYMPARMVQEHLAEERLFQVEGSPEFTRTAYLVSRPDVGEDWPWFRSSITDLKSMLSPADPPVR